MKTITLNLLLAGAALLHAQNQQQRVPFTLPVTVEVKKDIVYAEYGAKKLRLDLYTPKSRPAGPIAGIVVVRGGGWRSGDKDGFAPIAAGLADRGFAAACIEYRGLPDFTVSDSVHDTKAAVRWMRVEATNYGIRPDAIGAIGGSSGGHLVALLGTSYKAKDLEGSGGHPGVSSRVQAVVSMAGVFDFDAFSRNAGFDFDALARNAGATATFIKSVSPVVYLDKDSAAFLLIHGDADAVVPYSQSQEMVERCQTVGVGADLITLKGVGHGFWNSPQYFGDTIDQAATFFRSVLGK